VNTSDLQNPKQNFNLTDDQVTVVGQRTGQSDGWAMDNNGKLYFGNLPENALYETQTTSNGADHLTSPQRTAQSDTEMSWPDTFFFDNEVWV